MTFAKISLLIHPFEYFCFSLSRVSNVYICTPEKAMAGDINFFRMHDDEDERIRSCVEVDVMVAEEKSRRKGIAREALVLLGEYGIYLSSVAHVMIT